MFSCLGFLPFVSFLVLLSCLFFCLYLFLYLLLLLFTPFAFVSLHLVVCFALLLSVFSLSSRFTRSSLYSVAGSNRAASAVWREEKRSEFVEY